MNSSARIIDTDRLQEAEAAYRRTLLVEPDDMDTRIQLAWCLLLQALHQAGQEATLAALPPAQTSATTPDEDEPLSRYRNARMLLKECLRHMHTVKQLSAVAQNQAEVERLRALVKLSGGIAELSLADREAVKILDEITTDILRDSEGN